MAIPGSRSVRQDLELKNTRAYVSITSDLVYALQGKTDLYNAYELNRNLVAKPFAWTVNHGGDVDICSDT